MHEVLYFGGLVRNSDADLWVLLGIDGFTYLHDLS